MYYVVTKGAYSDYHIVGVTQDKEIAQRISDKFSEEYYECNIEEYEDGEFMVNSNAYDLWFDSNGECINVNEAMSEYEYNENRVFKNKKGNYNISVVAKDADSAIKIAKEKLTMYRAKEKGLI